MNARIRVLLVDDHLLFAEAIRTVLLRLGPDVTVRHAARADDALQALGTSQTFDLVLLDLGLPGLPEAEAFDLVHGAARGAPVVLVTAQDDAARVRALLLRGARGFVPKSMSSAEFLNALRVVLAGGHFIPDGVMSAPDLPKEPSLTARQAEVLAGIGRGQTNAEIGSALGISEATVRVHVTALLRELAVDNRTQAALTEVAQRLAGAHKP